MEENKTGKNVSSGAKKVERIENDKAKAAAKVSAPAGAKKTKKTTSSTKKATAQRSTKTPAHPKSDERAQKREEAAAEKRLNAAKAKAEKKEKKLLSKAQLKEKKLEKRAKLKEQRLQKKAAFLEKKAERKQKKLDHAAELKARREERKSQKAARREMLKNESKADRSARREREKKEKYAQRNTRREAREKARARRMESRQASKERRSQERRHKREQNTERRKHAPGFGGWLAAVISLGVACLALGTVVTAGAFRMNQMDLNTANAYRSTLYELVSVSGDMDNSLSKLRVTSGANEQRRLLTNLIVDSELMESALERMPIESMTTTDMTSFVNKTSQYSNELMRKLNAGIPLSAEEKAKVEQLYKTNAGLYSELNTLTTTMEEKDFKEFIGGKEGTVMQKMGKISKGTARIEETEDAPFSEEGNVGKNRLSDRKEISRSEAEELARKYFENYHVKDVQFMGETATESAECYNFRLTDEDDVELYAQITKKGGELAFFNLYEACPDKNFDLDTCDMLAREYLESLGIDGVEAVWLSDAGMVADITYVGVQNGVRIYPDLIRVRVCESKGRVVGIDAMEYHLNHKERELEAASSRETAQTSLGEGLEPYAVHLALIPVDDQEVLTHEFACTYGDEEYIIYVDVKTGEEVQIYRVRMGAHGSYLE